MAIVSPWNFPIATPAWKIAPALAFGNAVIWKPASATPASAVALTEIIARQDIPPGVFNLVPGPGREVGQRLVESPIVDTITFTGSVPVGRQIAASAIANMPKMQMEMGSKNPFLIMDDADLDLAVAHAANAAFGGTGQKCTAASRLIVHEKIHDAFVDKLVAAATALKVGHALEQGTQIGPVVSEGQLAQNLDYIRIGRDEGAELLCGGDRLERAAHFRANMRAGCVMVNLPTAGNDYHVPFGGRGASSYGPREQGRYAAEFYTTVKTVYSAAGAPE